MITITFEPIPYNRFIFQRNKFAEIGGQDVARFIRKNLRNLLTDEAALPYSWHGHRGNIAVCQFVSMETLIGNSK